MGVLSSVSKGKISFLAVCAKAAIKKGIKAGELTKHITASATAKAVESPTVPWEAEAIS